MAELGTPESLDAWVAQNAEGLEGVSDTRSLDGLTIDSALKVVRDFIAERKLVLYGGLAIDYALRAGGHPPIYPDTERPDYDAYTSDHARDAYELGAHLASLNFPAVSVIPAIHPQTIRVRVDFVVVADLSYLPTSIFARLPSRTYRGLRYVHPDFQRCDMHLDLSNPMGPGMRGATNIAYRGQKTARRLAMFDAAFPVGEAFSKSKKPVTESAETTGGKPDAVTVARAYKEKDGGYVVWRALTGYAALGAYRAYYLRLRKALPDLPERAASAVLCTATDGTDGFAYEVRGVDGVVEVVAGSEGAPSEAEAAGAIRRRPFLDLTLETWLLKGGRVRIGSHHRVRPGAVRLGAEGEPPVFAAHPAALQLYLLFEAWQAHWAGADPSPHLAAYQEFSEDLAAVRKALHATADRPGWADLVAECPFGYPLGQVVGCVQTDFNLAILAYTARDLRRPPPTDCGRPMRKQSDVPTTIHFDALLKRAAAAAAMAETPKKEATSEGEVKTEEVDAPAAPTFQLPTFEYGEHPDEIWLRDGGVIATE